MATHSSILAWRIPWIEEPSRLQSIGSQRVGHDFAGKQHRYYRILFSTSLPLSRSECWHSDFSLYMCLVFPIVSSIPHPLLCFQEGLLNLILHPLGSLLNCPQSTTSPSIGLLHPAWERAQWYKLDCAWVQIPALPVLVDQSTNLCLYFLICKMALIIVPSPCCEK